jgi:hypothetical protein
MFVDHVSAMQKYLAYACDLMCGLPSVTLLGEKRDWEEIFNKSHRLRAFGAGPTLWHDLLQPALKRFVETFDDPDGAGTKDF